MSKSLTNKFKNLSCRYIYLNYHVFIMFFLGFAIGIPYSFVFSTVSIWLAHLGVSKTTIGFISLVLLPYSIKFLWAPLLDNLNLPYLTKKLGKRRASIIIIQIFLCICICLLGFTNPLLNISSTTVVLLLISFLSASQEVIIDAYRIELLNDNQQGPGSATRSLGNKVGSLLGATMPLLVTGYLCEKIGFCEYNKNWKIAFITLSLTSTIVAIGMAVFFLPEPLSSNHTLPTTEWYKRFIKPLSEFTNNINWKLTLIFIITYRISFYFLMGMMNVFWVEVGFTLTQIAIAVKLCGFLSISLGTLLGGSLTYKFGSKKALMIGAILPLLGNYMLIIQYKLGPNVYWQYFNVIYAHFSGGLIFMCLITYLDRLCKGSRHTATQFAFLTSASSIGKSLFPPFSGYIVTTLGWCNFFYVSILLGLIPVILLFFPLIKIK